MKNLKKIFFNFCSNAKSTELLHSPPVFEIESDLDTVDHDFYDYAVLVPDNDFIKNCFLIPPLGLFYLDRPIIQNLD